MRRRRLRSIFAASVATLGLAACLPGGDPPKPPSSGESSFSSESSPSPTSPDAPQQREVDAATARKALPTLEDMPNNSWYPDISNISDVEEVYDPAECASVELNSPSLNSFSDAHRSVKERARFGQQLDKGIIAVYLESYDEPFPLAYFDDAGQHIDACGEFTVTRPSGTSTSGAVPLAPPPLGERSFGVRISVSGGGYTVDRIYVRSGHNLITVMRLSFRETYDDQLLQEYAQGVLDALAKDS